MFFRHGEQQRLCLAALREAGEPRPTHWFTEYVPAAKGLPADNPDVQATVGEQTRRALVRLSQCGVVRQIVRVPEVWWELAG